MIQKAATEKRVSVRKTYKLFIDGEFPRSESGRTYEIRGKQGRFLANVAMASRKDARDAVRAARTAFGGWSNATAYNRGQILYRIAEMMDGSRAQFVTEVSEVEQCTPAAATKIVDLAIDRWVWYAGWSDKYAAVTGSANPVAGPYFNFSTPQPLGVIAMIAPVKSSLLGLVSVLAPALVTGSTVVVVASATRPLPAVALAESVATSDLPKGVLNILTGSPEEIAPWLASHGDVNAMDLTGVTTNDLAITLTKSAAETIKRVYPRPSREPDWEGDPGLSRLDFVTEVRTVWHPIGA
jgi:acyl-CoA reductase-like NAD-dependent aldehyde dehydrogenase